MKNIIIGIIAASIAWMLFIVIVTHSTVVNDDAFVFKTDDGEWCYIRDATFDEILRNAMIEEGMIDE